MESVFIVALAIGLFIMFGVPQIIKSKAQENISSFEAWEHENNVCAEKRIRIEGVNDFHDIRELTFDSFNKQIIISNLSTVQIATIPYNSIIDCEVIEDNSTIMSGGLGRAAVGGVIGGGIGAMIGVNTRSSKNITNRMDVRIITNNIANALILIPIITSSTERQSLYYERAFNISQDIYATVFSVIKSSPNSSSPKSV